MTTLHDFGGGLGTAFGCFLLGSHNLMVTALGSCMKWPSFRTTSHTSMRASDYNISSTLIGGKGGAGPSSLHTMLEGLHEYVNARWMYSLTWHRMDNVSWSLGLFSKTTSWK